MTNNSDNYYNSDRNYDSCKKCKVEINNEESQFSDLGLCYSCETMYYNNDIGRCDICNNFTENWNNINDLTVCNCCLRHTHNNVTYNRIYNNRKNKLTSKMLCSRKKIRTM